MRRFLIVLGIINVIIIGVDNDNDNDNDDDDNGSSLF
jgi:hypothetical protein